MGSQGFRTWVESLKSAPGVSGFLGVRCVFAGRQALHDLEFGRAGHFGLDGVGLRGSQNTGLGFRV